MAIIYTHAYAAIIVTAKHYCTIYKFVVFERDLKIKKIHTTTANSMKNSERDGEMGEERKKLEHYKVGSLRMVLFICFCPKMVSL
jgi:hypothetical protein